MNRRHYGYGYGLIGWYYGWIFWYAKWVLIISAVLFFALVFFGQPLAVGAGGPQYTVIGGCLLADGVPVYGHGWPTNLADCPH